jgi:hypothetical protein
MFICIFAKVKPNKYVKIFMTYHEARISSLESAIEELKD